MAKENNLTDFLTDVADAIREKKGTTEKINPQDFSDEIKSIKTSTSMWTGHVDVEGLKAIGWDDEDIAYYQRYGVNWNEEDDQYHLVSDDNKALYGVLTADNIADYKDRIVYLPKIDTSGVMTAENLLKDCHNMVGMPAIDLSKALDFSQLLQNCYSLTCVPPIVIKAMNRGQRIFAACYALRKLPLSNFLSLSSNANVGYLFSQCHNIEQIVLSSDFYPTNTDGMLNYCTSLVTIGVLNMPIGASFTCYENYSLVNAFLNRVSGNISFLASPSLSKHSLIYIIEHEAATSAITITLHAAAYARLAEDADIVAALSEHTFVSLASA